jgi:hypothetical protein
MPENGQPEEAALLAQGARETLACEIGARPVGAPPFHSLASAARRVWRDGGSLLVDYDPAAVEQVTAVVEAERRCCSTIGWHLEESTDNARASTLRLRIEGSTAQLDVLEELLSTPAC